MERKRKILLFLILLFGLLLRIVWFAYGSPHPGYFSSDEIDVVSRTLKIAAGDFTPSHFDKPTFYNIVILPFYGLWFGLLRMTGFIVSKEDFMRLFIQRPCAFYWIPRLMSAILGTLSILLLYFIGKKVKNADAGVLSALLYSACFTSVKYGHIAKEDALMTFLILLCLLSSMQSLDKKRFASSCFIFLGALIGGLAASAKYAGVISLTFPFLFFIYSMRGGKSLASFSGIIVIPAGFIIGFCMGTPYAFLHPSRFLSGVYESTILQQIKGGTVWLGGVKHFGLSFILRMFVSEFGIIFSGVGVFAFCNIVFQLITRKGESVLEKTNRFILTAVTLFSFVYFFILISSGHLDYQYIAPFSPFWALYVSLMIVSMKKSRFRILKPLVILVLIAEPLYFSIKFDMETLGKDTRIQAAGWIENNVPESQKIAFDADYYYQYHPPIRLKRGSIGELERKAVERGGTGRYFRLLEEHQRNEKPLYNARFLPMPSWLERLTEYEIGEYDLDKLRRDGFQWLVASSYYFDRILEDKNPGWEPIREFYRSLEKSAKETARFKPVNWKWRGPEIIIYRIGEGL